MTDRTAEDCDKEAKVPLLASEGMALAVSGVVTLLFTLLLFRLFDWVLLNL